MITTMVGHASPRWISPPRGVTAREANQQLSEARAREVEFVFRSALAEAIYARQLGIELNGTLLTPHDPHASGNRIVRASAVGSEIALIEARGDSANNDQQFRRVDVRASVVWHFNGIARATGVRMVPVPVARTRNWSIGTRTAVRLAAGGFSVSALEAQFRNDDTGQYSEFWIIALGVGVGYHFHSRWLRDLHNAFSHLAVTMPITGHWHYTRLDVSDAMTHADWHGRFVMFFQAEAGVVAAGLTGLWLHIPTVLDGPVLVTSAEMGLAGFGAEVGGSIGTTVWRRMPQENRGSMRAAPSELLTPFQYDVPRDFHHECHFDTESSTLLNGEAERLRQFAHSLVRDYDANR